MGKNSKIGTIVQCLGKDDGYDLNGKPANSILFGTIKEVDNNGNYILSHIYNALNGSMDPLATLLLKPDNRHVAIAPRAIISQVYSSFKVV